MPVRGVNVAGDDQADREFHGGPDKAVYAYAREDTVWWEREIGRELEDGNFGENLTVSGVDVTGAVVGERWEVGSAFSRWRSRASRAGSSARAWRIASFPVHFAAAGRPGAYLRIVEEGEIGAGDEIRVGEKPEHGLTVGDVARIYHQERGRASALLLDAPELCRGLAGLGLEAYGRSCRLSRSSPTRGGSKMSDSCICRASGRAR